MKLTTLSLILHSFFLFQYGQAQKTYVRAVDECLMQRKFAKSMDEVMNSTCLINSQFPSINLATIDGKIIDDSYFKKSPTIVNFWFKECPPCLEEIPTLNILVEKYKINFLALGKDKEADIKYFLKNYPWSFDQIADCEEMFNTNGNIPLIYGYPFTIILDENRIIKNCFIGSIKNQMHEVEQAINKLLK
jgi:cytochrome c biogenesis protein CcmG, thiol:disulfide interchange protein DsbE